MLLEVALIRHDLCLLIAHFLSLVFFLNFFNEVFTVHQLFVPDLFLILLHRGILGPDMVDSRVNVAAVVVLSEVLVAALAHVLRGVSHV
jgi:hypothetical protein